MTCTFFGHRDAPDGIKTSLRNTLIELIESRSVDKFYVGNEGAFDRMVQCELRLMKKEYPFIDYEIVLAYMPQGNEGLENTVFPENAAVCPRRFAIDRRNRWMIDRSDFAVVYAVRSIGGASKFAKIARVRGLTVIEIM